MDREEKHQTLGSLYINLQKFLTKSFQTTMMGKNIEKKITKLIPGKLVEGSPSDPKTTQTVILYT